MEAIANVTYFLGFYPKFDDQTTPSAKFTLLHEMATYYELFLEVPLLPRPPPNSTRLDSTRLDLTSIIAQAHDAESRSKFLLRDLKCSVQPWMLLPDVAPMVTAHGSQGYYNKLPHPTAQMAATRDKFIANNITQGDPDYAELLKIQLVLHRARVIPPPPPLTSINTPSSRSYPAHPNRSSKKSSPTFDSSKLKCLKH